LNDLIFFSRIKIKHDPSRKSIVHGRMKSTKFGVSQTGVHNPHFTFFKYITQKVINKYCRLSQVFWSFRLFSRPFWVLSDGIRNFLREGPWDHHPKQLPKNFNFWNEFSSFKEHKQLFGNPKFYNFRTMSSNTSATCLFYAKISVCQKLWSLGQFCLWRFDHKKLINTIIKLYQSIERKLFYKTLYLLYVIMYLCNRKKTLK
jgi:hypothetical protein